MEFVAGAASEGALRFFVVFVHKTLRHYSLVLCVDSPCSKMHEPHARDNSWEGQAQSVSLCRRGVHHACHVCQEKKRGRAVLLMCQAAYP